MIKIYTLTCPISKDIKYIGKTSRKIETRYKEHVTQYKRNNSLKNAWIKSLINKNLLPIVEVIDCVDVEESNFWECHYISLYRSWGFNLKNGTMGGDGQSNISLETRTKISNSRKGRFSGVDNPFYGKNHTDDTKIKMSKPKSSIVKNKIAQKKLYKEGKSNSCIGAIGKNNLNSKLVYQYDSQNILINTYDCIADVEKFGFQRKYVGECLNGKRVTYKNFLWKGI